MEGIKVTFSGVHALDGVDVTVKPGEILGLIGPNGAGKTTMINVASGFQTPTEGRISIDGEDVTGRSPRELFAAGLARTFQDVRLFWRLTVLENVEVGLVSSMSRRSAQHKAEQLLEYLGLAGVAAKLASALTRGDQRRLGIVRALAAQPRFLLLDEPAAGLNEAEGDELLETLLGVRRNFECGLLLVEHDMPLVMRLCDRVQVLDYGRTLAIGSPAEIRQDAAVLTAYLGTQGAVDA